MAGLRQLVETYLESAGFEVTAGLGARELVVGRREGLGQTIETFLVWIPEVTRGGFERSREGPYLARFQSAIEQYRPTHHVMLVPTMEGLRHEFTSTAKTIYGVEVRVPTDFFDQPFSFEQARRQTQSAILDLRNRGKRLLSERVHQPYGLPGDERVGEDLLPHLFDEVTSDPRLRVPLVHVIVGPAGMGKSVCFEALFARLYQHFQDTKAQHRLAARPLALIPEHLMRADTSSFRGVLRSFLSTEFSRTVEQSLFEWMLLNGTALLMVDGLDEIVSRDTSFYEDLQDFITRPGSSAPLSVVLCVRDSVFATRSELRSFTEEYPNVVRIYELRPWTRDSIDRFAQKTRRDSAAGFGELLDQSVELAQLAQLPFYLSCLLEQFAEERITGATTESELLGTVTESMLDREYSDEKQLLDESYVSRSEVREYLEAVAMSDWGNEERGVSVDELDTLARALLPEQQEFERFVTNLTQIAFFRATPGGEAVTFAHEIIDEYFVGTHMVQMIGHEATPQQLIRPLSSRVLAVDSVALRIVAAHVRARGSAKELLALGETALADSNVGFKNTVQIVVGATEDRALLRGRTFDRRDLAGMRFVDLDLRESSFRDADLTGTEFRRCDLRWAVFAGAVLNDTVFVELPIDGLCDADFSDLSSAYAVLAEKGRRLEGASAIARWVQERTGGGAEPPDVCPAAEQVRLIFGKFIEENGEPRRKQLARRATLAGKRLFSPSRTLDTLISRGFLTRPDYRDNIRRCEGPLYSDMVQFRRGLTLSQSVRDAVADLCDRTGCSHVL